MSKPYLSYSLSHNFFIQIVLPLTDSEGSCSEDSLDVVLEAELVVVLVSDVVPEGSLVLVSDVVPEFILDTVLVVVPEFILEMVLVVVPEFILDVVFVPALEVVPVLPLTVLDSSSRSVKE